MWLLVLPTTVVLSIVVASCSAYNCCFACSCGFLFCLQLWLQQQAGHRAGECTDDIMTLIRLDEQLDASTVLALSQTLLSMKQAGDSSVWVITSITSRQETALSDSSSPCSQILLCIKQGGDSSVWWWAGLSASSLPPPFPSPCLDHHQYHHHFHLLHHQHLYHHVIKHWCELETQEKDTHNFPSMYWSMFFWVLARPSGWKICTKYTSWMIHSCWINWLSLSLWVDILYSFANVWNICVVSVELVPHGRKLDVKRPCVYSTSS